MHLNHSNSEVEVNKVLLFSGFLDHPYVRDGGAELPGGTRSLHGQSVQRFSQVHMYQRLRRLNGPRHF